MIQIFQDSHRSPTPIVAAVGDLQLQVFQARMESEYQETISLGRLNYTRSRWVGSAVMPNSSVPIFYDDMNRPVALFTSDWEMQYHADRTEGLVLLDTPPR